MMKFTHLYWLSVLVFASIHVYQLTTVIQLNIPLYITILILIGLIYFIQKSIPLRVYGLGKKGNGGIYGIQILLPLLYMWLNPGLGYLILLVFFILIEGIRHWLSFHLQQQRKLLESQRNDLKKMNETLLLVRKERHDFLKHISALHYLLENNNPKEAGNYLNELVEGYKETNLSIQGEHGTVAAMLHQSYQQGRGKGIEVTYDLESAISSLPLSNYDLTTLIGNILENALEASEAFQEATGEKAHIILQAYKRSGLFILNCKNDTLPLPNKVLDHLFTRQAQTTKTGNGEGLGSQIIAEVIKKYQGHLDFTYKNKSFTLHIKLPAIE